MLKFIFGNDEYKVNHLDTAMALYGDVYLNEIRTGYSIEVARASAGAAAEDYMTQYLSFKERGL